jgi:hypothetical protein
MTRAEAFLSVDEPEARKRFLALTDSIFQNFRFIVITLSKEDDPQVIFQTLNSGGEPLATMDLVRNDVFLRANFIDLYRRHCFVLEAKQGSNPQLESTTTQASLRTPRRMKRGTAVRGTHGWDEAMLAARAQAERYAKALPASEGWPPLLIVVDIGHSIELYADFSLTGKAYIPFPDQSTFRILLPELAEPEIQTRLRTVWLDPLSLDPSRITAKVTREVAAKLAILARNLEIRHSPKEVAEFLTRCIFTSFSEDVGLLPERSWLNLLESLRDDVANFPNMAQALWQTMNEGGFSPILRSHVLKFNGGLFESTTALPLSPDQLDLLIEAARAFHKQLCNTRVLDPACGSGNFLYVALEHMKRLEGEVLETLYALGETQQVLEHTGLTVDSHQLLGLELNPRAAVNGI